jgi:hypothetical protein
MRTTRLPVRLMRPVLAGKGQIRERLSDAGCHPFWQLAKLHSFELGGAVAFASAACRLLSAWIALSISATSGEQHLLRHSLTNSRAALTERLAENAVGLARRGRHDTKKPKPVEVSAGSCPPKP